jgi:hypothetical protein
MARRGQFLSGFHAYMTSKCFALVKLNSIPGLPDGLFSNQKIPIWVNFGGSCNGKSWHIL